jgi:hypothetical protein
MPIDFGKINNINKSDTAIHPREIFVALPGKEEGKFELLTVHFIGARSVF